MFPEEFGPFLLGEPDVRKVFLDHHRDLLTRQFWQSRKDRIESGIIEDFFPYPQSTRFYNDGDIYDSHTESDA